MRLESFRSFDRKRVRPTCSGWPPAGDVDYLVAVGLPAFDDAEHERAGVVLDDSEGVEDSYVVDSGRRLRDHVTALTNHSGGRHYVGIHPSASR